MRYSFKFKIVIVVLTVLLCACFSILNFQTNIFNSDKQIYGHGSFWTAPTLVADFNFSIYKNHIEYRAEISNARDSVSPVFILDTYAENNLLERIKSISDTLLERKDHVLKSYTSMERITAFYNQSEAVRLKEISKISDQLVPFLSQIYKSGYINYNLDKFKINDIFTVRLLPNLEYSTDKNSIYDRQKYYIKLQQFCTEVFNNATEPLIVEIAFKLSQPNLVFSEQLTNRAMKLAEQSVRKTIGIVHKGEIIVKRGDRLTEDKVRIIRSYNEMTIAKEGNNFSILNVLGSIGHSAMLYSILLMFLIIIRKNIWRDNYQLLVLSIPLVLISLMGWITFQIQLGNNNAPIEYLIFLPAFSMFIAIIFDSRTAFYSTVSMALMLAGVRGNDYFVGLTMLFTGAIAAYAVRDIQDRRQMFSSIVFIFIGFVISIFTIGFERGFDFNLIMPQLFLALINAIIAPVITFVLILLMNRYAKTMTNNLKLREYIDNGHPLLTELREKAPGTFEHSREVAQLAEIVAATIGANTLLVKVGGLFHDIGKTATPEYFAENKEQYVDIATHTKMTPLQSAEIIKEHVSIGIEKAKAAALPSIIIDFIPEHHGTTIVKHFYNVAVNEAKETGTEVNKDDFRYVGPKPRTKETTILMLCDSAEAVSKSTSDMKQFITIFESIIEDRIKDGQFDESNITMKEINKIREVIYNEIRGKIHTRTQYAVAEVDNSTTK